MTDLDSMFDDLLGGLDDLESSVTPKGNNNASVKVGGGSTLDDLLADMERDTRTNTSPSSVKSTQVEKPKEKKGDMLDDLLNEFNTESAPKKVAPTNNVAPVGNPKGDSLDDLLSQLNIDDKPKPAKQPVQTQNTTLQPTPVNTNQRKSSDNLDELLSQLGGGSTPKTAPVKQNPINMTPTNTAPVNRTPQVQMTQPQVNQPVKKDSLDSLLSTLTPSGQSNGNLGSGLASDILLSQGYRRSGPRPTASVVDTDNNTATNFSFKGTATAQVGKTHVISVCPLNDYNVPTPLMNYHKYLIGFLTNMNTGKEVQVYTKDNHDATYDVAFIAPDPGQYYLELLLCGNPLFDLTIEVQTISGGNWRAVAGQARVNETFEVSILPVPGFDPSVLPGPLAFNVDGQGNMKDLNIAVNSDGTYTVSAIPLAPGKIMFSISLHGEPVLGSPLNIFVINPQGSARPMSINTNPSVNTMIGSPTVHMNQPGHGGLSPNTGTNISLQPNNPRTGNMGGYSTGVTQMTPNNMGGGYNTGNVTSLQPKNLQPNNMGGGYNTGNVTSLQPNNSRTGNMGGVTSLQPNNGNNPRRTLNDPRQSISFGGLSPNPNLYPASTDSLESMLSSLAGGRTTTTTQQQNNTNDDELEAMMKELENYQ